MLTEKQRAVIAEMRDEGCAVVIFQLEELRGVDPEVIEEELIMEGNEKIALFS